MTRFLLTFVLPALLPALLYIAWLRRTRRAEAEGVPAQVPWTWLLGAGVLLAVLVAAGTTLMGEGGTDVVWEPAHTDAEGRVVPGRFR